MVKVGIVPDKLYSYQLIFKLPLHFIKNQELVFEGFECFSFEETNYEISDKDIQFLRSNPDLVITQHVFERVIDLFEKVAVADHDQSMATLTRRFYDKVQPEIAKQVP